MGGQRAVERGREQSRERRGPLLLRGRRRRNASRSRGGGVGGDALAGRAHGEGGGREVHVEGVHRLERAELGQLLLQPPVLLRQRLAAALQVLAVHLRLLQLRPARGGAQKREKCAC